MKIVNRRIRDGSTGQLGLVTKSSGKGWFEVVLDDSDGNAIKRRPSDLTFLEVQPTDNEPKQDGTKMETEEPSSAQST